MATKTLPLHKSILNLVPRLFLCKFVIYDPGSIWGEKYVISHNTGFNVIWEDREIQCRNTVVGKYRNTAVRMFIASAGREIFREIPISINYVLCRLLLRDASDSRINPLSRLRLIFPHGGKNKTLEREEIIIGDFLPREVSQIDFPLNNIQFFPSAPHFLPI